MRPVGRVFAVCNSKILILECNPAQLPRLYASVFDENRKVTGTLVDLFGNVERPYAAIVCKQGADIAIGTQLFEAPQVKPNAGSRKIKNSSERAARSQKPYTREGKRAGEKSRRPHRNSLS